MKNGSQPTASKFPSFMLRNRSKDSLNFFIPKNIFFLTEIGEEHELPVLVKSFQFLLPLWLQCPAPLLWICCLITEYFFFYFYDHVYCHISLVFFVILLN